MAALQTSGTTGAPKRFGLNPEQTAVMIAARAADLARIRPPGWAECVSYYNDFDVNGPGVQRDIKWTSDKGATLYRPLATFDLNVKQIVDNKVEAIFANPLFLLRYAPEFKAAGYQPKIILASGGPNLTPAMAKEIRATIGTGPQYFTSYSASEAGTISLGTFDQAEAVAGCVGKPCEGNQVQIVNGQIEVKTPIMIAGYADPKLTVAKFVNGWFLTGDKGSLAADGTLIWEGRM